MGNAKYRIRFDDVVVYNENLKENRRIDAFKLGMVRYTLI
jgi:hypothetical protein